MDKYEYNLKLEQIKAFLQEKNYKEAELLADTINWNKIKNTSILVNLGEVYEKAGRYEESREILLNAYDRSPIGRNILYRLTEVAIKMKDFDGAMEYYEEFVEIAPHDAQKYILKYELLKAKDADITERIAVLEEFKEQEYMEEWAYELAYLYHKANQEEQCIDACDELVLWFGEGAYVERALELKKLYRPLTKTQEEKYKVFCQPRKKGTKEIETKEEKSVKELTTVLSSEQCNTINLQAEILKGIQELMEHVEEKNDAQTIEAIKKLTEEIPYIELSNEQKNIFKNVIKTQQKEDNEVLSRDNLNEFLGQDADGQMHLLMGEKSASQKQIEGQMNINDILGGLEDKNTIDEQVVSEEEVFQESDNIMDRLNDVIPQIRTDFSNQSSNEKKDEIVEDKSSSVLKPSLTEEQKAIFSYFVPIQDMEEQLCKVLDGIIDRIKRNDTAATGNLIIQGSKGCGKTVLATGIIKVLQKEGLFKSGKVGKIEAKALNKKDIQQLFKKVSGGCLIIESAGELEKTTAVTLSKLLEQDRSGIFVVLEDSAVGIKKAISQDRGFSSRFTEKIIVPIFTNEELVSFAKSYANELGYKIDAVAILALHNRISSIAKTDQETRLEEVKEIVDEAIEKEANSGLRKAFNILTAKRYTDDEKIVLTEKDFE